MTLKLSSIRADLERERAGDWVDSRWQGDDGKKTRFRVSAKTKPSFKIKSDQLFKKLARTYKDGVIPDDVLTPAIGKLLAEELLHDWEGIDVPYSRETALEYMTDPAYRELVSEVEYCCNKLAQVDIAFVEDEVGKSAKPSGRSSKSEVKNETSSET
ncbi:hypothetical protein [EBPR siphovirus 3]|nr:hypothetical protein [EBPR siphovirus 3]